jgi:predicted PurR-regulated permease PerM
MNETWDLIRNVTEVIGMVAVPVFTWVVYTLVQQGKSIIVLEQKVNQQLGEKIKHVQSKISKVEMVISEIHDNVIEHKILLNAQTLIQSQISDKFDDLVERMKTISENK